MNITVVIPVKDEQDCVQPLVAEIRSTFDGALTGCRYEVIFVDDGSTDRTAEALESLRVRVVRHGCSAGQSAAVWTGVRQARYEYIVVLDGDGQNPPAEIAKLVSVFADPNRDPALGMAIGARVDRRDSGFRKWCSGLAFLCRRMLLKETIRDSGCGLKMLPRDLFLTLPYFDHMHRFMPSLVRREGRKVVAVPVAHRPRTSGRSCYGALDRLFVGIADLWGVRWLLHRKRKVRTDVAD